MLEKRGVTSFHELFHYKLEMVVGKKLPYSGTTKIEIMWSDMWSGEKFVVVRAPILSSGPYVIKKLFAEEPTFRVTGNELKICVKGATAENNVSEGFYHGVERSKQAAALYTQKKNMDYMESSVSGY